MIKIGLTGNRYSGKDTICDMFTKIGIHVFDSDLILKFILNYNMEVITSIRENIDKNLYKKVYDNNKFIYKIDNSLIKTKDDFDEIIKYAEPYLFKAYDDFIEKREDYIYTIFKSSILFERMWSNKMDYNISVFTPKIERMNRFRQSSKLELSKIAIILRNDIDDIEKNNMANFIIHNYSGKYVKTDPFDEVNKIDKFIIDEYINKNRI